MILCVGTRIPGITKHVPKSLQCAVKDNDEWYQIEVIFISLVSTDNFVLLTGRDEVMKLHRGVPVAFIYCIKDIPITMKPRLQHLAI